MNELRSGKDATIITSETMAEQSMAAAEKLAQAKIDIRVISVSSGEASCIDLIINAAIETGALVTVEEQNDSIKLKDRIADIVGEIKPVTILHITVVKPDIPADIESKMDDTNANIQDISYAVKRVLAKKIARGVLGSPEQ